MSDFNGISLGSASIVQLVTIIGSIMVPLAIFGLGLAHNIKKRRREQALQFITQITITEPMVSESHNLYNLLLKFNDQKPTIEDLSVDELKTVMIIGSFYEFLGLSLLQKLLNQEVILLSRFAVMEQTWNTFEGVIFARREALDRQFLFGSFEKAVKDFKSTYVELQARNYPKPDGHVSNHPFVRFFK